MAATPGTEEPRRFAVVGCRGMLGRALTEELRAGELARRGPEPALLDLPEFDIARPDDVRRLFRSYSPDVVLNAAGYTDVDGAEDDPAAAERANVTGPKLLAQAAADVGALLVHVSTDYVFGGRVASGSSRMATRRGKGRWPYAEDDAASPEGVYARTKLDGEEAVRRHSCAHLIVRSAWLHAPWGKNFVRTILAMARQRASGGERLRVVDDQRGSPSYAPDLARAILDLVDSGAEGTFHVVNSGEATWHDVASEAVRLADLEVEIAKVTTAEFPRAAPRPAYSVLSTAKLERALGRALRHWREALAECVGRIMATDEHGASRPRAPTAR